MTEAHVAFDPTAALDELLAEVGLSVSEAGGSVSFAGQDPIMAARHRHRGGPGQDLHLDLRQAAHHITPHAFWRPTIAGPTVGRTLAEQGADVLCATRPMDYEHDFI